MPICSISTRVAATSANTPPPVFTTKVLPLYMRMYGAAPRSALMASDWSLRFMIMSGWASWRLQQLMEHGHLRRETVIGLALHDAARAVEHLVGDCGIAPHRQTVHHPAVGCSVEPVIAHAPAAQRAAQPGIARCVSVAGGRTPLFRIEQLSALECLRALARLRSEEHT